MTPTAQLVCALVIPEGARRNREMSERAKLLDEPHARQRRESGARDYVRQFRRVVYGHQGLRAPRGGHAERWRWSVNELEPDRLTAPSAAGFYPRSRRACIPDARALSGERGQTSSCTLDGRRARSGYSFASADGRAATPSAESSSDLLDPAQDLRPGALFVHLGCSLHVQGRLRASRVLESLAFDRRAVSSIVLASGVSCHASWSIDARAISLLRSFEQRSAPGKVNAAMILETRGARPEELRAPQWEQAVEACRAMTPPIGSLAASIPS